MPSILRHLGTSILERLLEHPLVYDKVLDEMTKGPIELSRVGEIIEKNNGHPLQQQYPHHQYRQQHMDRKNGYAAHTARFTKEKEPSFKRQRQR